MTENKRFVVEKYSIRDMSVDTKYINSYYHIGDNGVAKRLCDLLNEINDTNKKFGEERWAIMELIIEYDTTSKYSEKDVIDKIKDIMGLVMIE